LTESFGKADLENNTVWLNYLNPGIYFIKLMKGQQALVYRFVKQ
jgi:hypothetical protein